MKEQAGALLQRINSAAAAASSSISTATGSTSSSSSGGGTQGSAGSIGAVSNAVYAGLKFSSLAMRVAQDVVTSVTDDAGRMLRVGDVAV